MTQHFAKQKEMQIPLVVMSGYCCPSARVYWPHVSKILLNRGIPRRRIPGQVEHAPSFICTSASCVLPLITERRLALQQLTPARNLPRGKGQLSPKFTRK